MDWTNASAADIVRYCHKLELDKAADQKRMAKELDRVTKEQARQAAEIEKLKETTMKLEDRLATAESELIFNREMREKLFSLLDIEELELDASLPGSRGWQKHQRKVISLNNQIHAVQKRIDKYTQDKRMCERKLEALKA